MTTANILAQLGSPGVTIGFKNKLINGSFLVWQRGTSVTPALNSLTQYTADRWACYQTGAATAVYIGGGPGAFQYSAAFNGVASNSEVTFFQCIESVNSYPLFGSQATFSVWVYATVAKTVTLVIDNANSTNNFSSTTALYSQAFSHTGSGWQQFTLTTSAALPAGVQNGIRVRVNFPTCTTGTFAIAGAQLEAGSTATQFEVRDYGTEFLRCQRYYNRVNCNAYACIANGIIYSTTLFLGPYQFPVPMLYAPTLSYSSLADFAMIFPGGGNQPSSITFDATTAYCARWNISGTGWVAGAGYMQGQNSNAWLAMSAEL
jgi:hypothetical protein